MNTSIRSVPSRVEETKNRDIELTFSQYKIVQYLFRSILLVDKLKKCITSTPRKCYTNYGKHIRDSIFLIITVQNIMRLNNMHE